MADGKPAFDVTHPGFKEYAIVVSLALGGFLLVEWYRNRASGTAASNGTTSAVPILQGPGMGSAALWLAIQDLAGKSTTTTKTTKTTDDDDQGTTKGPPPVSRVHRQKRIQHQIHDIHKEHEQYEKDKGKKKRRKK